MSGGIRYFLWLLAAITSVYFLRRLQFHPAILIGQLQQLQIPINIPFYSVKLVENESPTLVVIEDEPFTRHIVAVGDLHGDMPNARKVLRFANVVDDFGDWSGNVDFFVQTGDIIDR